MVILLRLVDNVDGVVVADVGIHRVQFQNVLFAQPLPLSQSHVYFLQKTQSNH